MRTADQNRELQSQYLGTSLDLDLKERAMDAQIQDLERKGDIYSRGLEMDRIQTLLAGALGQGSAANSAAAASSAASSNMFGQLGSAAISSKGSVVALTIGSIELLKTII